MKERTAEKRTVLICCSYGGWGVSRAALHRLREIGNKHALAETDIGECWPGSDNARTEGLCDSFLREIPRDDPQLLTVFEEMGQEAAGRFCEIQAIEIPADVEWEIEDYDGNEWVSEVHRTWR